MYKPIQGCQQLKNWDFWSKYEAVNFHKCSKRQTVAVNKLKSARSFSQETFQMAEITDDLELSS